MHNFQENKNKNPKTGLFFLMQNVISLVSFNFGEKCETESRFHDIESK